MHPLSKRGGGGGSNRKEPIRNMNIESTRLGFYPKYDALFKIL